MHTLFESSALTIRWLGLQEYLTCWQAMQDFTNKRLPATQDEIWLLEHFPVFTKGQNNRSELLCNNVSIPIVQSDRGGQITYHGPGQLMVYTLIDLKQRKLNVRELVRRLEQTVVDYLASLHIPASNRCDAPGVYIEHKKICSIGLRIRRGASYHGIAFNVNMDLQPFSFIHPCGFPDLKMIQLVDFNPQLTSSYEVGQKLIPYLLKNLGYVETVTV